MNATPARVVKHVNKESMEFPKQIDCVWRGLPSAFVLARGPIFTELQVLRFRSDLNHRWSLPLPWLVERRQIGAGELDG